MDNKKLVQHIKIDMSGVPKEGLYCHGEASLETNLAMQEPLAKLYHYEKQPDVREKITEYISERKICGLFGCPRCKAVQFTTDADYIRMRKESYKTHMQKNVMAHNLSADR